MALHCAAQHPPEVGFLRLLLEVEPHQRLSDIDGQGGAADGIDQQRAKQGRVDGVQDACEWRSVHWYIWWLVQWRMAGL